MNIFALSSYSWTEIWAYLKGTINKPCTVLWNRPKNNFGRENKDSKHILYPLEEQWICLYVTAFHKGRTTEISVNYTDNFNTKLQIWPSSDYLTQM